jgi:16S rRNA (uracil1498-N3)-methyltransferase
LIRLCIQRNNILASLEVAIMRLHRFYISTLVGNQSELTIHSVDLVNQIRRVFRLNNGDRIIIFDGSGSDYVCSIKDSKKESVELSIIEASKSRFVPETEIVLYASLVKKDNFEWIVEKATELGVSKIIPIISERSEKKSLNIERLKKIAIEASEQSGRGTVPIIESIGNLEQALLDSSRSNRIAFHTEGALFGASDMKAQESLAVFIGPEGGWSEMEIEIFHKNKVPVYSLGPQVLRAETAVVAALAVIVFCKP